MPDIAKIVVEADPSSSGLSPSQLQDSEARYRRLFEAARDGILLLDVVTGRITDVNPFMVELLGYSRDEFLGKELWEIGLLKDAATSAGAFRELQANGYIRYEDLPLQAKSGKRSDVEFVSNIYEENGRQVIQCNIRDITERKQADEALRQSEANLRAAQQIAHLGSWELDVKNPNDLDRNPLRWSDEIFQIFGVEPGQIEVSNTNFLSAVHPDDRERVRECMAQALQQARPYSIDHRITLPDGGERVVQNRADVYHNATSSLPFKLIGTVQDITERKRTEAASVRLASIVESSDDAIISKTLDGVVTTWNAGAERMYGYVADEAVGRSISFLAPPNLPDEMPQLLDKIRRGEPVKHYETVRIRKDGSSVNISLSISPLKDAGGSIIGASSIKRDITQRLANEQHLRLHSQLLGAIGQAVIVTDTAGTITFWNDAAKELYGWAASEVMGQNILNVTPADTTRTQATEILAALAQGKGWSGEVSARRRDGSTFPAFVTNTPVLDAAGEVTNIIGLSKDISERKQGEEALRESEARYRALAEAAPDDVFIVNREGRVRYINRHAARKLGLSPEALIGKSQTELFPPEVAEANQQDIDRMIQSGQPFYQERHRPFQDREIWLGTWFVPVMNAVGEIDAVMGVSRDISGQKQAAADLQLRAEELASSNQDLARFNRLAVGRELRMVELKQQVNDLSQQLNLPAPARLDFLEVTSQEVDKANENSVLPPVDAVRKNRFFLPWLNTVVVLTGIVLAWFALGSYQSYRHTAESDIRILRLSELRGTILHLDEVLSMSVRMAALTGEPKWKSRYRASEPPLDAAFKELRAIDPDSLSASESDAANKKLAAMEKQAFALVDRHRLKEAQAVLGSEGYGRQKRIYARGVARLSVRLQQFSDADLEADRKGDLSRLAITLIISPLLVLSWLIAVRAMGQKQSTLRESSRQLEEQVRSLAQLNTVLDQSTRDSEASRVAALNMMEDATDSRERAESLNEGLRQAEESLQKAYDELESRVTDRTIELGQANENLNVELAERKRTEEALRETQQMLQLVMNHIPQAIFWKDRHGTFLGCNHRLASDAGFDSPEAMKGKTDKEMPWSEHAAAYREDDRLVMESDAPKLNIEELLVNADGKSVWLRTNKIPLHDLFENVVGVLCSYEDITEQKQAEALVLQAKREADAANAGLHAEIIERQRAEAEVQRGRQELQSFIDAMSTLAAKVAPDGTFLIANKIAFDASELSREEYMKMNFLDGPWWTFDSEVQARVRGVFDQALTGISINCDEKIFAFGQERTINFSLIPIQDLGGKVEYLIAEGRDITQLKHTEAALLQAKAEAERANLAKSEFLSRMSHELRTPLNAILGFGQIMERQDLSPKCLQSVGYILKGGRHLLDLINEVLDIASVEAGHVELSLESVDLADVVPEVCALVRPLAAERQILLNFDTSELAGKYVLADIRRLKQVLINLLSNAIKYNNEAGQVHVTCADQPGHVISIAVVDMGPGISSEDLPKLFTPFERLGASASTIEGTGLGLVLSQRLLTAMRGTLTVQSVVGHGTTFTVELPRTSATEAQVARALKRVPRQPSGNISSGSYVVLCIEDNPSNLRLMETIISSRPEIRLITAIQGSVGLDMARQHEPDLILLDLDLPDIHGREVLARLQKSTVTRDIPVIIISADATPNQIERLLVAGARSYLTKPIDVDQVLETLDKFLAAYPANATEPIRGTEIP